jgi:hypothetical protein
MPKAAAELVVEYEDAVGHNSNYLLELSPYPQGRIPLADVAAYKTFVEKCYRGSHAAEAALLDQRSRVFELAAAEVAVDRLLLEEDMASCGQAVTKYTLSSLAQGKIAWDVLTAGGSIGHSQIHRLATPLAAVGPKSG